MESTLTTDRLVEAQGTPVYSADGEKIGSVEEIYVDEDTGQPEWIGIGTGFLGTKRALIPVRGAELRDDGFYVPYSKDQVKDMPEIDEEEISQETESTLYAHYGLDYSERRSATGLPEGGPGTGRRTGRDAGAEARRGAADEGELVRTEEELRVGKRGVQAGRARLRKWVETEPVEEEVELRRERVRVEREPIDRPVGEAEIGEQDIEVPVHREEPVVQKETVAKERIGLEKDVETEREQVTDEVRKERVDVEGDVEEKRKRR